MAYNLTTHLRTGMSQGIRGGTAAVDGTGEKWTVTYSTNPTPGDTLSLYLLDGESAVQVNVGAGDASAITPTFCMTYGSKVYVLAGSRVYFSAVDLPKVFNDPEGIGNGYVTLTNQISTPEDIIAVIPFQGKLAFFSRQTTQIWSVAADPAGWALQQTLENIGCVAKNSVKAKGDLDVLFLSDTGIRSLRARETSLNGYVDDIGAPIDSLVQAKMIANPNDVASACSVIEPKSLRYWLFLKDTIYVLSYFPSSKVTAWSTYEPKDSNGNTFVPSKFVVYNGQVYAYASNKIYRYGGSDNNTYDSTVATVELPWLDLKHPAAMKQAKGMQAAYTGAWSIKLGMDPVAGLTDEPTVWSGSSYTYNNGEIGYTAQGTHFKMQAVTTGATAAIFSSLVFKYDLMEEV